VLAKALTALLLILIVADVLEQVIPVTTPPLPVEVKLVMVLELIFNGVPPLKREPIVNARIEASPVILEKVLEVKFDVAPIQPYVIPVIVPVPPVQLLKVFPITVLLGLVPAPSEFVAPAMAVAPVTVMLEKLLFVNVWVEPLGELELDVDIVTVPPAVVLLNAVTMELLFNV
jgi:hypothetical protein